MEKISKKTTRKYKRVADRNVVINFIHNVAVYYDIDKRSLLNSRTTTIKNIRHAMIYFIKTYYKISLKATGELFSGLDHSTIFNTINQVNHRINYEFETMQGLFNQFNELLNDTCNYEISQFNLPLAKFSRDIRVQHSKVYNYMKKYLVEDIDYAMIENYLFITDSAAEFLKKHFNAETNVNKQQKIIIPAVPEIQIPKKDISYFKQLDSRDIQEQSKEFKREFAGRVGLNQTAYKLIFG